MFYFFFFTWVLFTFILGVKNIALETVETNWEKKEQTPSHYFKSMSSMIIDSLAYNECFLATYPDSHEFSIHLVVIVAGTANSHP